MQYPEHQRTAAGQPTTPIIIPKNSTMKVTLLVAVNILLVLLQCMPTPMAHFAEVEAPMAEFFEAEDQMVEFAEMDAPMDDFAEVESPMDEFVEAEAVSNHFE